MTNDSQEQSNTIAEFNFFTNKSFCGRGNPITIPSRFNAALKEHGLDATTPAGISFRGDTPTEGWVYVGSRAGGKYFQIRVNAPKGHGITRTEQGINLRVRLVKRADDWCVELK